MAKFPLPARLFSSIEEVEGKVVLTMKNNGMKMIAKKTDFQDYEFFKKSIFNNLRPQ